MPESLMNIYTIRDFIYTVFHDFVGVFPTTESKTERKDFALADLQYVKLASRPNDPPKLAASILRKAFHSVGFSTADTGHILSDPSDKTIDDLAQFIKKNHVPIWPED